LFGGALNQQSHILDCPDESRNLNQKPSEDTLVQIFIKEEL
jgi:hypothetical protein